MVFAKQNARQTRDHAGRKHTSGPPAYAWRERTDNKLWFLQNKTPDRPTIKPAGDTRSVGIRLAEEAQ